MNDGLDELSVSPDWDYDSHWLPKGKTCKEFEEKANQFLRNRGDKYVGQGWRAFGFHCEKES